MNVKFLKRILIAVFVAAFIILPCAAGDLMMEGCGSTAEKARENARSNLSEYINGVFVESSAATSTYDDTVTSGSAFSSSSSTVSNGYLKAVEYENEYQKGNTWYSTAVIRDNATSLSVFSDNLKNNKRDIDILYGTLSSQSSEQKKNSLITIYGLLTEYEAYRTILVYMGHPEYVPSLSYNISTTSVFIEYQNIIIEEGYALEEREKYITDETEHKQLLEELSANRTEQRRLEREKNEAVTAREEAAKIALEERLRQLSVLTGTDVTVNTSTDETRYASLRENILLAREAFLDACTEYDMLCKEQFQQIDKDYEAEKAAVEARPYRYAELNGSEPTPAAKQIRDDEIAYLYSRKEMHKVAVLKQIRASLVSPIREKYDEFRRAVEALDGEIFEIILGDNTIKNVSTVFDSINVRWTVSIEVQNIGGVSNVFSFTLTYKQLTGENIKEAKYFGQEGYDEYMAYLDDIDYLDNVIKAFTDSFRISLKFKAVADKESYGIGYDGIDIEDIQFVLESNALSNPDWSLVIDSGSVTIENSDLTWVLPGYSRIFNGEFDV